MQRRVVLNFCLRIYARSGPSVINTSANKFFFKITWPVNVIMQDHVDRSRFRGFFSCAEKRPRDFRIFQMNQTRDDFRDFAEEIDRSSLWLDRSLLSPLFNPVSCQSYSQIRGNVPRSGSQTFAISPSLMRMCARARIRKDPLAIPRVWRNLILHVSRWSKLGEAFDEGKKTRRCYILYSDNRV